MLFVFPIIRNKVSNDIVDVNEKFFNLYQLLTLIQGISEISYEDMKEKITIYLKGFLNVIFFSIHTEFKKHLYDLDLINDFNENKTKMFTEKNVDEFIDYQFKKRAEKVDSMQIIKETDIHQFLFHEILFLKDLFLFFNDFVKDKIKNSH